MIVRECMKRERGIEGTGRMRLRLLWERTLAEGERNRERGIARWVEGGNEE